MSEPSSSIVSKVWEMCNPLCNDRISCGDDLDQLTPCPLTREMIEARRRGIRKKAFEGSL